MMGAKHMKFCGAVARALLIGVKFGIIRTKSKPTA